MSNKPKATKAGWIAQMSTRVLDNLSPDQRDLCVDVLDLAAQHRTDTDTELDNAIARGEDPRDVDAVRRALAG